MRLIACGSVDDGKSTLIGRLLNDAHGLPDDEVATLAADSRRVGTRGGEIDYALALDGLAAEREQGITIDVAHRYFSTATRRYILADAPGHEQYTRNMATAASRADLALVLVDARKGVVAQTRRHTCLLALLGVPEVVLVVNKMDLAGYSREAFEAITRDYAEFAAKAGLGSAGAIPTCATLGENVVARAESMPWYAGPSVMERLEETRVDGERVARGGFRMPVQSVMRFDDGTRAYAGMASGADLARGERVVVLPSGREAQVDAILGPSGELPRAAAGQSVALKLSEHLDVSRGDLVCAASRPASVATQFDAHVIWIGDEPLLRGRDYLVKCGTRSATATVSPVRHKLNVETLEKIA
ncbi:MAG TPA: GTP-binding protein, partial [Usitatibacter sp.]|nr:GTP-binding protein [Usitatibacter sp.]